MAVAGWRRFWRGTARLSRAYFSWAITRVQTLLRVSFIAPVAREVILPLPAPSRQTLGWEWGTIRISREGGIAWVFANGELIVDDGTAAMRAPYRMTAVLQRS